MTEKEKKRKKGNSKRMFSWMNPDLEVRETGKKEKGIFTKKDFKKGELLTIFGGYILSIEEEIKDTGIQISENFVLTSFPYKESTDFFNHSCNPNSGIKGQNFLVSIRKIKKNEEVCFDYATCLYSSNKEDFYSFECNCGCKECRRVVTSNDWKMEKLQEKYDGFFQWFLQEKINEQKY
jgi:hypothetical protein